MQLHVDSEVGRLRAVLLGSIKSFKMFEPINATQRYYFRSAPPQLDVMIEQQARFAEALERHGVAVYWTELQPDSPGQVNTRDLATVIGDTLVVCAMKEPIRRREPESLNRLLAEVEGPVVRVDAGIVEGGDVVLDGALLYAGLSERTDRTGLHWLTETFGHKYDVMGIQLERPHLHLDVVFNLVGDKMALVYPLAIADASIETLAERYELIEVTSDEAFTLAPNVLSLSPETVIADKRNPRVNAILRECGLEVVELDYSEVSKIGGSFRCGSCALIRDPLPA